MKLSLRTKSIAILTVSILMAATSVLAQRGREREPLGLLKRVIAEAGAPDLTSDQETQLNALIIAFRSERPSDAEQQAHKAYNTAILAADLSAAQAQAAILAQLSSSRLQAVAKLEIDILGVLKNGGQLEPLKAKFGDRLVQIIGSLAGPQGFGGPGDRPRGGPGGKPGSPESN